MKKFLVAIAALFIGTFSVIADDVSEIKQLFIRNAQYTQAFNLKDCLTLYAKNYFQVDKKGKILTYQELQQIVQIVSAVQNNDLRMLVAMLLAEDLKRTPTEQEIQSALSRMPADFMKTMQKELPKLQAAAKKSGSLQLQTLKFVDIKVFEGRSARVVVEYTDIDEDDETLQKTKHCKEIVVLIKENGSWKILSSVEI